MIFLHFVKLSGRLTNCHDKLPYCQVKLAKLFGQNIFTSMKNERIFGIMVLLAFIGVISFFHVDSYVGDKYGINWLFVLIGVIFSLGAIGCYGILWKRDRSSRDE